MSVGISLVRALVEELDRQGKDGRGLLRKLGLSPALLDDAHARIDLPLYDEIQRRAIQVSGDPAFGLHMGEYASIGAFNLLGHMATHCRTIREGLDIVFRYYRLVADVHPPYLIEEGDVVRIVYEYLRSPDPICNRIRVEFGLVRLLLISRAFTGSDIVPGEAWFDYPEPKDSAHAAEYQRIFRGQQRFEQEHSGFVIPRVMLDATQVHHDDSLLELMRNQAEQLLHDLESGASLSARIRRLIVDHYTEVAADMASIAKHVGMSERSLRRRLKQEGTSFQQVVRESMGELARRILQNPSTTIHEAAFRLGFVEPSSFHRAFKRWTGLTPAEYRRSIGL